MPAACRTYAYAFKFLPGTQANLARAFSPRTLNRRKLAVELGERFALSHIIRKPKHRLVFSYCLRRLV
jgi:hypothetical protein